MTARAGVVVALLGISLAAGLISGRDLFFNLSYTWAGLLVLSFVWSRSALSGIRLKRWTVSLRSQVSMPFEEFLSLSNRSRMPKAWVEVEDRSEPPGHRVSGVTVGLGANRERTWIVCTWCDRRGAFRLGPAVMHGGDPFGLFPVSVEVQEAQRLVVLPLTAAIGSFSLPSGQRPGGEALRHRTHQVTPSASAVRDCAWGWPQPHPLALDRPSPAADRQGIRARSQVRRLDFPRRCASGSGGKQGVRLGRPRAAPVGPPSRPRPKSTAWPPRLRSRPSCCSRIVRLVLSPTGACAM